MGDVMRKLKADGDTWSARLAGRPGSEDARTVVFFCTTTDQRPYRVVEVSPQRLPDGSALASLSDAELEELFVASRSMDFPRSYRRYEPGST